MTFKQGMRGAAALAVAAPLALSPAAVAGGNPHGTPPGQAKAEGEPAATPAAPQTAPATPPAKVAPKAPKAAKPANAPKAIKPAKPGKRAKPGKPAKPAPTPGNSMAAPGQDKVMICHATGSATNPYVTITIPPPAVRAHQRHQDGRDIVPAPAGGCPAAAPETARSATPSAKADARPPAAASAGQPAAPATPSLEVLAERVSGGAAGAGQAARDQAAGRSGVLGETGRSEAGAPRPASPTAAQTSSGGGLPFTGFDGALVAAAGLAALLGGAALRRSLRSQAA